MITASPTDGVSQLKLENAAMEQLKDIVGKMAVLVTVSLFLSGIFICKEIKRRGWADDISPLPFLTAYLSCTVWLLYGVSTRELSLCIVNLVGVILQVSYLVYYYFMCTNKRDIQRKLVIIAGILLFVSFIIYYYWDDDERLRLVLGYIASTCTLLFMGSPLAEIVTVYRTKSTKTLPLPLIVTSFTSSFLWTVYGLLIRDKVVQMPNMLATFITVVQLLLFVIYRGEPKSLN